MSFDFLRRWQIISLTTLILFSAACQNTANPLEGREVLFQDDFSSEESGWEIGEYQGGSVGYLNGGYFVTSTEDGTLNWGVANRSFGDVDIRVNVTQVHAPSNNNNGFGVACRLVDGKDGYFLMISGDGLYAIIKFVGGSPAYLVNWTTASTIRQGNASNQLRAVCQGSQFSLYVNGGRLASVTDDDPDFASGDIGFAVTTLEDTPTEVHFDSLTVTSP